MDIQNITSFQLKIAENLANISTSPNDKFKLVKYEHDYSEFTCDLCGHKHCTRKYVIENLETKIKMNIGSECINHFKDKGIDINLAEGLMKRVEKATTKSRKEAVNNLGHEIWNSLPLEEKQKLYKYYREGGYIPYKIITDLGKKAFKKLSKKEKDDRTIKAYVIIQAKQLLIDATWSKTHSILTEQQIQDILDLGLEKEYNRYKEIVERRNK